MTTKLKKKDNILFGILHLISSFIYVSKNQTDLNYLHSTTYIYIYYIEWANLLLIPKNMVKIDDE
jgi:hypothetical protein